MVKFTYFKFLISYNNSDLEFNTSHLIETDVLPNAIVYSLRYPKFSGFFVLS